MRTAILAAITFALLLNPPALATVVLQDDFSNNGALVGTTADIGGVWAQTGTTTTNPLTVASTALSITTTGQDANAAFSSSVANTAGTSVYSGLDINLSAVNATGDYFFHLSDPAGTTSNFYQRLYAKTAAGGYQLGLAATSGTATYGTTVLSLGTTYHVALAWNFLAGATNDTFSLYVDPTSATEGGNTAYLTLSTWGGAEPAATVAAGNIRQGTAANAPTLVADNLIVATTFAEVSGVSAIPEASAFAFGSVICGAAGMIAGGRTWRRRRAA